jgi:hypothetical protein
MRKQDMMLAKLDEDNKRLTEELALVKAEGQSMTSVADRLEELQLQATGYESLIDQESTRVDELGSEVRSHPTHPHLFVHAVSVCLCVCVCAPLPCPPAC